MTLHHRAIESCPSPLPPTKPIRKAPEGSIDTHFHIFEEVSRYPLSAARLYDPPMASVESYLDMANVLGITRMVVVQASIYGIDNSCLLDSIGKLGLNRARGVAVVDQSITPREISKMHARGVRGIRFNAITGSTPLDWLPTLADMIAPFGWHIQLWAKGERLLEVTPLVQSLRVPPVVLDHMGRLKPL
jgi:predicted TIM-barrel fold metal-dependent hydrolase